MAALRVALGRIRVWVVLADEALQGDGQASVAPVVGPEPAADVLYLGFDEDLQEKKALVMTPGSNPALNFIPNRPKYPTSPYEPP